MAQNGVWEEALEVEEHPNGDGVLKIENWLLNAAEDVAIEAFFGNKLANDFCFLGIRVASLTKGSQKSLIMCLIESIDREDSFDSAIKKIELVLRQTISVESKNGIFNRSPEFLELGVEGFWKTFGSYIVWTEGKEKAKSIEDININAPQLLKKLERHVMLEHAWKKPLPMWLAIPVSRSAERGYVFDEKKYNELIESVLKK